MKMLIVCFAEHLAMISREMKRITSLNELLMAVKMTSVNLMLQILAGSARIPKLMLLQTARNCPTQGARHEGERFGRERAHPKFTPDPILQLLRTRARTGHRIRTTGSVHSGGDNEEERLRNSGFFAHQPYRPPQNRLQ